MKTIAQRSMMVIMVVVYACFFLWNRSLYANSEEEIGRSNLGEWKGGKFYEYMTKEFICENDFDDTITYRIRYRLKHWGDWYTFQVNPVNLYINDQFITSFRDELNVQVKNEDHINGTYTVTMKKGVSNKMELRDSGVSITVINVSGNVYAPLPVYQVTFVDGFGHTLKEENVTKYQSASPPYPPVKDGYAFIDWEGSYSYVTSNRTIRATWKQNAYTLKVFANGGTWNGSKKEMVYDTTTGSTKKIPDPLRSGYIFDGWDIEGLGFFDGFVHQIDETKTLDVLSTMSTLQHGWGAVIRNDTATDIETLEAIRIELGNGLDAFFSIQYRAHCQNIGWMPWVKDGDIAGTLGDVQQMEAIEIQLNGRLKDYYDIEYRAYVDTIGWQPWVKNAQTAGTVGQSKAIQCLQIRLKRKALSILGNHMFYCLSGDARLVAQWLPEPYIDTAFDRWFLVQEEIRKEDILQLVKAYDEYHDDISNKIILLGFEKVKAKVVGDYEVQVQATTKLGNTCVATIIIHVIDKLTQEHIRAIDYANIDSLDRDSKWQKNKILLKQKLNDKTIMFTIHMK